MTQETLSLELKVVAIDVATHKCALQIGFPASVHNRVRGRRCTPIGTVHGGLTLNFDTAGRYCVQESKTNGSMRVVIGDEFLDGLQNDGVTHAHDVTGIWHNAGTRIDLVPIERMRDRPWPEPQRKVQKPHSTKIGEQVIALNRKISTHIHKIQSLERDIIAEKAARDALIEVRNDLKEIG